MKWTDCLTHEDKLAWHAEKYAWRRVRLGVSRDEQTSPTDPEGHWFVADMVDEAKQRLRGQIDGTRTARANIHDAELLAEAPAVENEWAQKHGYTDFQDYMAREQIDHVDAACNVARSLIAAALLKGKEALGEPADADPKALLKALGVTAKEVDYSPEAMRRARIALGIEEHDDLLPPGLDANGKPTGSGEAPLRPEAAE
jgi:hypothetical protein